MNRSFKEELKDAVVVALAGAIGSFFTELGEGMKNAAIKQQTKPQKINTGVMVTPAENSGSRKSLVCDEDII